MSTATLKPLGAAVVVAAAVAFVSSAIGWALSWGLVYPGAWTFSSTWRNIDQFGVLLPAVAMVWAALALRGRAYGSHGSGLLLASGIAAAFQAAAAVVTMKFGWGYLGSLPWLLLLVAAVLFAAGLLRSRLVPAWIPWLLSVAMGVSAVRWLAFLSGWGFDEARLASDGGMWLELLSRVLGELTDLAFVVALLGLGLYLLRHDAQVRESSASPGGIDMGSRALVWGVGGLLVAFLIHGLLVFWIGPLVSVVAIYYGATSRRLVSSGVPQSQGKALAGIVCGVIGLALGVLSVIALGVSTTAT